jgi:hypothetical protein
MRGQTGREGTDQNLPDDTVLLGFNVDGGLVRLLLYRETGGIYMCFSTGIDGGGRTISKRTSPALNASPSFFFHDAIPPSVIVGDIAGI